MPELQDEIELRSEEVQEVMQSIPHWMIRWGISLIFTLFFILMLMSWMIKYPDVISSEITITSRRPPVKLVARKSGTLHLLVKNESDVLKGTPLAFVENPTSYELVRELESELQKLDTQLNSPGQALVIPDFDWLKESEALGELHPYYTAMLNSFHQLTVVYDSEFYNYQIARLEEKIQKYEQLNRKITHKQVLALQEKELLDEQFKADSLLFKQQAISKKSYKQSLQKKLGEEKSLEDLGINLLSNQLQLQELRWDLKHLRINRKQELENLQAEVKKHVGRLLSQIALWKQTYVLEAPVSGRVTLFNYFGEEQTVTAGENILSIVQDDINLLGLAKVPVSNSGKLEKGQKVNIRLRNYPAEQYGMLTGEVHQISLIPKEKVYYVQVSLPEGLRTTYQQELDFKHELNGQAAIVTEDLRLLERLLYQIRKIFSQASQA